MDLQERVVAGTLRAVTTWKPLKVLVNAGIYAVFVGLVYYLLLEEFDVLAAAVCVAGGIVYSVSRDFFSHRRIRAGLAAHLAFIKARHPGADLYVPIVEKLGSSLLLKRAGLFLEDGKLALEAYNQPAFAKAPKDAITVPHGADFRLFEAVPEARAELVGFRGELLKNNYRFHVFKDAELVSRLLAFAEPRDAEPVEPAAGKE